MPKAFVDRLREQIILESGNYFTDNFDLDTFGDHISLKRRSIDFLKRFLYGSPQLRLMTSNRFLYRKVFLGVLRGLDRYMEGLDYFYARLADQASKDLLVKLVAFRALGHVKVRLPLSSRAYWDELAMFERMRDPSDFIALDYKPWRLYRHDLGTGHNGISLYLNSKGVFTTFGLNHYRYQGEGVTSVEASPGDVVLDLGGCYGDTALYFGDKVGSDGKVFVFEFIPQNLLTMKRNLNLNTELSKRVRIVERPVWDNSGQEIFFSDRGAGSRVEFERFDGFDGTSTTISVDDFVEAQALDHVNFLKTDIEGAEPAALSGAVRTLRRFRPNLAVSIYHSMDDFVNLIRQIDELDLGYRFYLGHATIYASETVLFCRAD
jgi:FkbM family methyltransferase